MGNTAPIKYDICKDIEPVTAFFLGQSWGEALGEPAAALCASARAADNYKEWKEDTKQCNGTKTPALKLAPIKLTTQNLVGLKYSDIWTPETPNGEVIDDPQPGNGDIYYALEFWLGLEVTNNRIQCIWFGIDGPDDNGGKKTLTCSRFGCSGEPISIKYVHTVVEDVLNDLGNWADDGSAIDLIIETVGIVLALIVVVAIAALLSSAALLTIGGAGLLGGALVG